MFGLDKFNPVSFVTQTALASMTGGASLLVSQMVGQIASQLAQNVIQTFGQQLGLPQTAIDLAQGAVAANYGDFQGAYQNAQEANQGFAQQFFPNATPSEQGQISQGEDVMRDAIMNFARNSGGTDEDGNPRGVAAGRASGQSWLMALARALGAQLDAAQGELERTMDGTDWKDAGQVAEFQAQSQQFALFMNTATNVIKTVGESLSTMARKQ